MIKKLKKKQHNNLLLTPAEELLLKYGYYLACNNEEEITYINNNNDITIEFDLFEEDVIFYDNEYDKIDEILYPNDISKKVKQAIDLRTIELDWKNYTPFF